MTEQKYITSGQAYVWHTNQDCPLVGENKLKEVEESEVPDPAHPCSHRTCTNGLTANDLKKLGEKA